MGPKLLETENLCKDFSGIVAVDGISMAIEEDDIYAVVGPNGAGKTTLFRLLSGTLVPSDGVVRLKGEEVTGLPPNEIANRGITRSYQITTLFDGITALENVAVAVQSTDSYNSYNFWSDADADESILARAEEILELINLEHKRGDDVTDLSYGQQRMLEVGVTLATQPDLMLLDEPANGLSTDNTLDMMQLIKDISEETTVVFIEHNMDVVDEVADTVIVLHQGQLLTQGSPGEVRNDEQVRQVYLQEA